MISPLGSRWARTGHSNGSVVISTGCVLPSVTRECPARCSRISVKARTASQDHRRRAAVIDFFQRIQQGGIVIIERKGRVQRQGIERRASTPPLTFHVKHDFSPRRRSSEIGREDEKKFKRLAGLAGRGAEQTGSFGRGRRGRLHLGGSLRKCRPAATEWAQMRPRWRASRQVQRLSASEALRMTKPAR